MSENDKPKASDTEKPTEAGKPEMMEVPVDKMQSIMESLEALEKRDKERDEEIEVLRESVSRGKLEEAEGKRKPKGPPKAKVMIHNGNIVVGWKMVKNEMIYHPQNLMVPAGEDLQIELTYSNKKKSGPIKYVDFVRNLERADVTKVGQNGIMWEVEFTDPEISVENIEIDPQFLNP